MSLSEGGEAEVPSHISDDVKGAKADALAWDKSIGEEIRSHPDPISSTRRPYLACQLSWYFPQKYCS